MNRCALAPTVAFAAVALSAPAMATPRETVTFNAVPSNGTLNSAANGVRTTTFAGGYAPGRVDFSGVLTAVHPTTWRTDSRIRITTPSGHSVTVQPFSSGTTFTTAPFSGSFYLPSGAAIAGEWSFRFYETIDDGGTAAVDANVDVTVTLTDEPATPPASSVDLGTLGTSGASLAGVPVSPGQVRWYRFTLPQVILEGRRTYLDIDTAGTSFPPPPPLLYPDDTQMGLYDSAGRLVASDNDSGPGFTSALSFGAGARPPVGDSLPFDGRNGPLTPGTYYLAVGPYALTFGAEHWLVTGAGTQGGTISLNLRTNTSTASPCTGDWDNNGAVEPSDVAGYVNVWFADLVNGTRFADLNANGIIEPADVSDFVNAWFQALTGGGC